MKPTMTSSYHLLIIFGFHCLVRWHMNHVDTPMYSLLPVQSIKTQENNGCKAIICSALASNWTFRNNLQRHSWYGCQDGSVSPQCKLQDFSQMQLASRFNGIPNPHSLNQMDLHWNVSLSLHQMDLHLL